MARRRKIITVLCVFLIPGSVSAGLYYAFHMRTESYRRALEGALSDRLGMRVSIGSLDLQSALETRLLDVEVSLSGDGPPVFSCAEAVWEESSASGRSGSSLELSDGWLVVGMAGWSREEYERMLAGSLGHDFAALGIAEVRLRNIELRFRSGVLNFTAERTNGVILFDDAGDGHATLESPRLNHIDVDQPVRIEGRFTPGETLIFHEVTLAVSSIPLRALGAGGIFPHPPKHGEFSGTIRYVQGQAGTAVEISGSLRSVDLIEFTGALGVGPAGGPYHGILNLEVEAARISGGRLESLIATGSVSDLRLAELLPGFERPETVGRLDLQIESVRWIDNRFDYLQLSGRCADLSLEALSSVWGPGRMTGSVAVDIRSLLVVDDVLREAEVTLSTKAPDDQPGMIDRELLARVGEAWTGVNLSLAFPRQVEYSRLGATLLFKDNELTVLGDHGPDQRTILTLNLFGRSWEIIKQPKKPFKVSDPLAWIRSRGTKFDGESVRSWWEKAKKANAE